MILRSHIHIPMVSGSSQYHSRLNVDLKCVVDYIIHCSGLWGWLFGFYSITFVGYLMPYPFYTNNVLFQKVQFSMSTQFKCKKKFLFQAIQFSQTVLIQTIQFSISIDFVYTVKCQNSSISSDSV